MRAIVLGTRSARTPPSLVLPSLSTPRQMSSPMKWTGASSTTASRMIQVRNVKLYSNRMNRGSSPSRSERSDEDSIRSECGWTPHGGSCGICRNVSFSKAPTSPNSPMIHSRM